MFNREENERRVKAHYKDPTDESFLLELNNRLSELEERWGQDNCESFPSLFIFGLPRSGTTLLYQLVAYCFDIGYVNNLMARFWKTPVTGIKFSNIVLGSEKRTSFTSYVGQTQYLAEPHEFGYFWADLFGYKDSQIKTVEQSQDIQWESIKERMESISRAFQKPVVYKNLLYAFHLRPFVRLFDKAVFLYMKRDLVDTAISILNTRINCYGNKDSWWSAKPPQYESLKDLPYREQIPGQMYFLNELFESGIQESAGISLIEVAYNELCEAPQSILDRILEKCSALNIELAQIEKPPQQFNKITHKDHGDFELMKKGLARFFSGRREWT